MSTWRYKWAGCWLGKLRADSGSPTATLAEIRIEEPPAPPVVGIVLVDVLIPDDTKRPELDDAMAAQGWAFHSGPI